MVAFEILINGERVCMGQDVTAATLVVDWIQRRHAERVSLHLGYGDGGGAASERQGHWVDGHLRPGDEVTIRIVDVVERESRAPEECNFCRSGAAEALTLVTGKHVSICGSCISLFAAFVKRGAPLPVGASIQDDPKQACGFCGRLPGDIAGLVVRNDSAICPECLRICADLLDSAQSST